MSTPLVAKESPTLSLPPKQTIHLTINNQSHTLSVAPWTTLLDALRLHLGMTGTKKGCDHGQCGACTVLKDGKNVNSCLCLAVMQEDAAITTIEGLANGEELHPVQQAFLENDAYQCGYCTSGQICSTIGMLNRDKGNSPAEIRDLMSGNICRCGAYNNIYKAITTLKEPTSNQKPTK